MATVVQWSLWSFQDCFRASVPTKGYLGIFVQVTSGPVTFVTLPKWKWENSKSYFSLQMRLNKSYSCFTLYMMTKVKGLTINLCKSQWGHVEAISGHASFLPVTFDWKEIQTCGWSHCAFLVETHRMIFNMTFFWWPRDLELRANLDLDLLR